MIWLTRTWVSLSVHELSGTGVRRTKSVLHDIFAMTESWRSALHESYVKTLNLIVSVVAAARSKRLPLNMRRDISVYSLFVWLK